MIIHQIWMQGEANLPPKYRAYATRLRELNPEMPYRLWSEPELERVCASISPRCHQAWRACRYMHQRVDFGRYCLVYVYGGVTVDMDAKPLKPFKPLLDRLPRDALVVSRFPVNTVEASLLSMQRQTWWLNNATLIAHRPRNRACRVLIDRVADRILGAWWVDAVPRSVAIAYTTGPMFFMHVFRDVLPRDSFVALPHTYLEPCSGFHDQCRVPPEAILDHDHDGTWQSGFHTVGMKAYFFCTTHPVQFLTSLALAALAGYLVRRA